MNHKKQNGMSKELYLLRGLPGSGKSTLAKSLGGKHLEADMYFIKEDEYQFDASKLKEAHKWCQDQVYLSMATNWERIVVSNTFTVAWEMQPYLELAKRYGYKVYSLVVENRHGGVNEHGVPAETLDKMEERFTFKLR